MSTPVNQAGADLSEQYRTGGWAFSTGLFDVYGGADLRLGREIHLRFLKPQFARNTELAQALGEAATAAAALLHPNLVAIYDIGSIGHRRCLVTEAPMARLAQEPETPTPGGLRGLAIDYLTGLQAAHSAGIVHGAIDHDALCIGADGTGKLADAGLFSAVAVIQRSHGAGLSVDADLRSLASTLIRRSTGEDEVLETVLRRALSANPSDRYETAEEIVAALAVDAVAEDDAVAPAIPVRPAEQTATMAAAPSSPRRVLRALRSVRAFSAWILAALALVVLFTVALSDSDPPTPGRVNTPDHGVDLPPEIPH
ncbi:MAG TPA: hypothetical protein VMZ22_04515 [Acidimicrobiales bacterium]|nr:hypothetical protein [Acidimicrobiales bacterium]